MRKLLTLCLLLFIVFAVAVNGQILRPRIVFEKYLFAEGINPKARYLDRLMVKFFDEDMVRLRNGGLISLNGGKSLAYTQDFLARHPEITPEIIITTLTEEEYAEMIKRNEQLSGKDLVDLFSFYRFRLTKPDADPKALLADILNAPEVEIAYYESIPYQATCTDVGGVTPNYRPNQTFHDAAPGGVDADYAWATFGEDVTDGVTTNRTAVIEYQTDITPTHEDYTTLVLATPEHAADTTGYHGGSVAGIVGACEENGVGVVGLTADHMLRYYDITALASVADVYTRVNAELSAGDYTTGSWAYFADPLPAGQTCPCNPGQNGHVPAEYDPATKTAIDNGVAAGIHYLESAGNGCTNLDDATFGTTFRWSTDTGAMIVGGVESAPPHDAICYTGYGERVTLNAWAENIVTTGKGTLRTGSGRREWYADDFGGTSGAGPIVAGCGGILNNLYRNINSGANISPTTLRSWLAQGGTVPGTTPGNIGVMPNLFAITSPNLNPDIRSGWTDYIVPRNTADATSASCVLPSTLLSDPDTTIWNSSIENTSNFGTATPGRWYLYRDDVWFIGYAYASMAPLFRGYYINWAGSPAVRGGRHTIRLTCDPNSEVTEYYEDDNDWVEQYVWNPRVLTAESPLEFTAPPLRLVTGQTGVYYNCDGYNLSNGFSGNWDLMGVIAATTSSDYDARIGKEAITSQNGFDTYEAWSGYIGSTIDIVGKNQHNVPDTAYVSVINWDGTSDDYDIEGETSTSAGTPGYGRNSAGSFTITSNEIMEAVEFYVNELVLYDIEANVIGGDANLSISIFGPDDGYFSLSNRNAYINANGSGMSEELCFTPSSTGYHLALFHKSGYADWHKTATFTAYIGKAEFDLTHNLNTGWSNELVVRQSSGAQPAVLPATLAGNVSTNYLNAGLMNIGCVSSPFGLSTAFYKDGPLAHTASLMIVWDPDVEGYLMNQGPIFVFGGRHNIGEMIDVNNDGAEWLETNNRYDEQYVWTPYSMTNNTTYLTSGTAPNWRNAQSAISFTDYNVDGWRFTGTLWSGVGMCPTNCDDDYNIYLYNPATSSTSGFNTRLVNSWSAGTGKVEFCVENGNLHGNPTTFDVGVNNNISWPTDTSRAGYRMFQSNSVASLINDALNGPYTLSNNQLIHVFDLNLTAGDVTRIYLDNLGATDLCFSIFEPTVQYGSRSSGGTNVNAGGDGVDETYTLTPAASGHYGIVVYKNDCSDMASTQYKLIVGDRIAANPQHLVLQVINNMTSPIQMRAHWDSVLVDNYGNPMNIDLYQLYYTFDPNIETFPAGWTAYTTTSLATLDFTVDVGVGYFRMVVVAQDNDGFILGHSELPGKIDLIDQRLPNSSCAAEPIRAIRPVDTNSMK